MSRASIAKALLSVAWLIALAYGAGKLVGVFGLSETYRALSFALVIATAATPISLLAFKALWRWAASPRTSSSALPSTPTWRIREDVLADLVDTEGDLWKNFVTAHQHASLDSDR